jgi:hypothetical protein
VRAQNTVTITKSRATPIALRIRSRRFKRTLHLGRPFYVLSMDRKFKIHGDKMPRNLFSVFALTSFVLLQLQQRPVQCPMILYILNKRGE